MTKNATLGSKRLAPYGSFRIKKEDKNKPLQASDMPDIEFDRLFLNKQ